MITVYQAEKSVSSERFSIRLLKCSFMRNMKQNYLSKFVVRGTSCADQRGSNFIIFFLVYEWRDDSSTTIIGPSSARQ